MIALYTFLIAAIVPVLILLAVIIVARWRIFVKAGHEGWESIIPIYNTIMFLRIVGKPDWWILLFLIPGVNIIYGIWTVNMLSKSFGKDEAFTVGLILLPIVFYPILAFSDARYRGPYGNLAAFQAYGSTRQGFDFDRDRFNN